MQLEMRSSGIRLNEDLRGYIERKLGLALGRFATRVRRVHVQMTDLNGPKGGEAIECSIRAHLHPRGELVVQEARSDPFGAVARAAQRVRRGIARQTKRLAMRRRGRT